MGLFCIPNEKNVVPLIECAIGNCKIFLEYGTIPRSYKAGKELMTIEEQRYQMLYLLQMSQNLIEDAITKIKSDCKN